MDISTLLGLIVFLLLGFGGGWVWRARQRPPAPPPPREIVIRGSVDELRAIGELSVFKAVSKDLITHSDHTFGDFGRKYLSWAFTKKKLAMVFEFEMDFRYDLRSELFRVESVQPLADQAISQGMPQPAATAVVHMPPCRVDVSVKDLAFYDEQRAKLLPWLLPDLVQGFFDGSFSEDDKNRLIAAARAHALAQAQSLADRYRAQVERSAYSTLHMLVRPLGYPDVKVIFAQKQELSTDVGTPSLESVFGQPAALGGEASVPASVHGAQPSSEALPRTGSA